MPSSYTTSLRLTLPATGELAGQWGTTVNTGITELLDSAVAGTTSISTWGGAGVAYTLSNNSGTADEARRMFIVATGTPGEAKNVICPAVSKFYVFRNDTTGGFALTLKTPSGTGIAVPAGQYKFLYCDGTNVVEAFNSAGALTLSGALSVGGTATFAANPTLSAGTANQVQYLNASKVLVGSANLTFDGTALTLGGNPTVSAGTANGVTYLNASKVLTSGSVFAFNGTSLLVGKNTTDANNWGIQNYATNAYGSGIQLTYGGVGSAGLWVPAGSALAFGADGGSGTTELMRLTSTGLGIGTSSPTQKLDVSGAIKATGPSAAASANSAVMDYVAGTTTRLISYGPNTTTPGAIQFVGLSSNASAGDIRATIDSSGNLGIGTSSPAVYTANSRLLQIDGGANAAELKLTNSTTGSAGVDGTLFQLNGSAFYLWNLENSFLSFGTSNTERMRLDSSGNLGLGVTPSAWGTTKALEFSYGAFSANSSLGTDVSGNCYYNGTNWIYRVTGVALRYNQATAGHSWHVASGTAGNAISFSQVMTLDASGNLGVGVTSPAQSWTGDPARIFQLQGSTQISVVRINSSGGSYGDLQLVSSASSEVGIYNFANGAMRFGTNNTERARITSGGKLLVGTTSTGGTLTVDAVDAISTGTSSTYAITCGNDAIDALAIGSDASYAYIQSFGSRRMILNPQGNEIYIAGTTDQGAYNLQVNGTGVWGAGAYVNGSDERLKEEITTIDAALDVVNALRPVTFRYKEAHSKDQSVQPGFIAQELQAAMAGKAYVDGVVQAGPEYLNVAYQSLIPLLTKAIQEQQALITDLRARVAALEA